MLEEIQFKKDKPFKFAYSGKMPRYNITLLKRVIPRLKGIFYEYKQPFILTYESTKLQWYFQIEEMEKGFGRKRRGIFINRKGFNVTY